MKRKLAVSLTGIGVLTTLALASPSFADAPAAKAAAPITKFKKFETWGWSAELPADWKEWLNQKADEAHPYDGKWGFHSANKNFRLRIKIRRSGGKSWKERTRSTFEKLFKRMPGFGLLGARSYKHNGRDIFTIFGRVRRVRNRNDHEHLIYRMLIRFPTRKLRMVATFVMTPDRADDSLVVIERFLDTFAIVEPASVKAAIKKLQAKRAGK